MPFTWPCTPSHRLLKTNPMTGDEIEFFAEIRQWRFRFDSENHASHSEQSGGFAKERLLVDVDADAFVTKLFADVEKISRPAAEIENA